MRLIEKVIMVSLVMALTACGGGTGFIGNPTPADPDPDPGTVTTAASSMTLLASSPQLLSGDANGVTISALVKDDKNVLLKDETVTFSADSGELVVTQAKTDAGGVAMAKLTSDSDKTSRNITISATLGSVSKSLVVALSGTTITIAGQSSIVLNKSAVLTMTLKDSYGNGIEGETFTVSSANGNTLASTTLITDSSGQASVTVTGVAAGTDTLTVSALGVSKTYLLAVSGDDFSITTPAADGAEVSLSPTSQTITARWFNNNTAQNGKVINFYATRGTLTGSSATTANGVASVAISSTNAGPSLITASVDGGPSTTRLIEFVATTPSSMDLQTNLSSVGIGGELATLTATVRDANNNLVKNKTVTFSLDDVTGGQLSVPSDITDSNGQAGTVYASSSSTSAKDGVKIRATVAGTAVTDEVTLTVGKRALFITLGTGNVLGEPDDTNYSMPYTVRVADAAGVGVKDVSVSLSVIPKKYYKGYYVWTGAAHVPLYSTSCNNEDADNNGKFDVGDTDENSDELIWPGNIATVSQGVVTTDSSGAANFTVDYSQEYAQFIQVSLEARANVGGTESLNSAVFLLPVIATDVNKLEISPPGRLYQMGTTTRIGSPYGLGVSGVCNVKD